MRSRTPILVSVLPLSSKKRLILFLLAAVTERLLLLKPRGNAKVETGER